MSSWKTTKLRNKIHVKHGFPFKSEFFKEAGDYVVLTPGNFHEEGGFKRNAEKDKCYSHTFPPEYLLKQGDLIVAMTEQAEGLLGSTAQIPRDNQFLHNQRLGLITATDDDIDLDYIFHLFKTKTVRSQIRLSSSGSKVKHTSPERIYDVQVQLPPLSDQRKIAKVLATLDAKIALNNRINAELEAMAKLLYDYWFVQFDFPMTAAQAAALGQTQLEGQPYKSSGGKMVFNPTLKREIPEGWEARSISSLTDISKENTSPAKSPNKEFKLFSIPIFDQTKTYSIECGTSIGSDKFVVSKADLLVSKLNPWYSRAIYAEDEEDMVCSTEFVVWRTKNEWSKNILYIVATDPRFIGHCVQSASGTSNSHKRVSPDVMISHAIPYDETSLKSFALKIGPMIKAKLANQKQNQELTTLRDWLLPMLMNGQVVVD